MLSFENQLSIKIYQSQILQQQIADISFCYIINNMFCSVVSDLLMSEALTDQKPKQKSLTKSEDSGHDSGQSSLNTGDQFCLISVIIFSVFRLWVILWELWLSKGWICLLVGNAYRLEMPAQIIVYKNTCPLALQQLYVTNTSQWTSEHGLVKIHPLVMLVIHLSYSMLSN